MPSNPRRPGLAGLVAGLAATALAGTAALIFAQAAHASTSPLRATFEVPDATKKGYDVQFTVANIGKTPVTGWKVEFDLPAGTAISKAKGVDLSHPSANHYVLASKQSTATIAGGAARMFSFLATGLGRPVNCLVNGTSCTAPVPVPAPSPTVVPGVARTVNVANAAQLKAALLGAHPGDVVHLADGTYKGAFYATVSGTSTAPITLTGSRNAVLTN